MYTEYIFNIARKIVNSISFLFCFDNGLIKVDLEFSFSIPGLFQTWNSNKPGFEKLNSRSEPRFEKLNSRSELELSKKAIIK